MKVIASKEQQINCIMDKLQKLPELLENINRLRSAVEGEEQEKDVRGGHGVPGFMRKKGNGEPFRKRDEKVEIDEKFDEDNIQEPEVESSQLSLPGPVKLEEETNPIEDEDPEEEDPWDEED